MRGTLDAPERQPAPSAEPRPRRDRNLWHELAGVAAVAMTVIASIGLVGALTGFDAPLEVVVAVVAVVVVPLIVRSVLFLLRS